MSTVIQGSAAAVGALTGLARALVQQGKLRPDRAENFARKATQGNTHFIDELVGSVDVTGLSAAAIAKFAADTFGHALLDLSAVDIEQLPKDIIDKNWWRRCAYSRRKRGILAVAVPTHQHAPSIRQVPDTVAIT